MLLETDDLLTAAEFARTKGVTRKTVYNWLAQGIAPASIIAFGIHLFNRTDVESFVPPSRGKPSHEKP